MSLSDYLALTKPKITPLLLMAALGSAVVAARGLPPPITLAGVLVGGALASSGALALNSYLEMGMDAKMKRTMGRPLPAGRIVQSSRALVMGLGLLAAGIAVAALTLDVLATLFIALGASASTLGQILLRERAVLEAASGVLIVLFGIFMLGLFRPWGLLR
ncbi:MAG: UbiA family prenyltransferase, partial [Nitrososphaerota archaeon]|nr:UbiA family prenyltransferase [Nitrososphaerota archaeon]